MCESFINFRVIHVITSHFLKNYGISQYFHCIYSCAQMNNNTNNFDWSLMSWIINPMASNARQKGYRPKTKKEQTHRQHLLEDIDMSWYNMKKKWAKDVICGGKFQQQPSSLPIFSTFKVIPNTNLHAVWREIVNIPSVDGCFLSFLLFSSLTYLLHPIRRHHVFFLFSSSWIGTAFTASHVCRMHYMTRLDSNSSVTWTSSCNL